MKTYQLSTKSKKILLALKRSLIEEPEGLTVRDCDSELIRRSNLLVGEMPFLTRVGLVLGLKLFDALPFFFGFGFRAFRKQNQNDAKNYVDRWLTTNSPVKREFFKVLRGLVMMSYFSHKDVWHYIGYFPAKHVSERLKLREELMKSSAASDRSWQ